MFTISSRDLGLGPKLINKTGTVDFEDRGWATIQAITDLDVTNVTFAFDLNAVSGPYTLTIPA